MLNLISFIALLYICIKFRDPIIKKNVTDRQINDLSKAPSKDTSIVFIIIIHKSYLKPKNIFQNLLKIYFSLYQLSIKLRDPIIKKN
jgi:hypothetical protein